MLARYYSQGYGRFLSPDPGYDYDQLDPMSWNLYSYVRGNPVAYADPNGLLTIYFFDRKTRPKDNGVKGTTYTALVCVEHDNGTIVGPYKGRTYPNSKSNFDNSTKYNTVKEGTYKFNNKWGHKGGTKKGINLVNEKGERKTPAVSPDGKETTATFINIHEGFSDNGNYNSSGSHGCLTISPYDAKDFFSNFDWSGNSSHTTGKSQGYVVVNRQGTDPNKNSELLEIQSEQEQQSVSKDVRIEFYREGLVNSY